MTNAPTIQNVLPSAVVCGLVKESYGTYVIRAPTKNDDIISSIQLIPRTQRQLSRVPYVVLSVSVDETIYQCPVMNYYLPRFGKNGEVDLLDQYHSQRRKLDKYTALTHELILLPNDLNWTFDPKNVQDINFIKGEFSGKNNAGVSNAKWVRPRRNDVKIFIKRFSKTSTYFNHEFTLLRTLCFFPIIALYGQYSDKNYNYLVFAHAGVSLESKSPLRASSNRSLTYKLVNIGFQIANAMIYLDKNNIVHRDLTAGNVLVDDYGYIRIADFGHAIRKIEGANNLSPALTHNGEERFQIRFLPPECLPKHTSQNSAQNQRDFYASFSSKSDVWSFGILIIQLMLIKPSKPYPDIKDDAEVAFRIVNDREIHPQPAACNLDLYLVLKQCWAHEVFKRISFTDLREKMHTLASLFHP